MAILVFFFFFFSPSNLGCNGTINPGFNILCARLQWTHIKRHLTSCIHHKTNIQPLEHGQFEKKIAVVCLHLTQKHVKRFTYLKRSGIIFSDDTQIWYLLVVDIQAIMKFWNLKNACGMVKGLPTHPQNNKITDN